MSGRTYPRLLACLATVGLTLTGAFTTATAQAADPQIEVTAQFDKPSYRTGEQIKITLRLKNVGSENAVGIKAIDSPKHATHLVVSELGQWGDLGRQGVTIEPGASVEAHLTGFAGKADADVVTLDGHVFNANGFGIAEFSFSAPIEKRLGHAAGTIFRDENSNGTFDQGEAASGVAVTLGYAFGSDKFTATSDANGKLDFGQIPTVRYFSGTITQDGWVFPFQAMTVDESDGAANLRFRGVRPLHGELTASMAFTKDTYKPGELAHITVALSNSSTVPLIGIVASCDRGGFDSSLDGTGPGWGKLSFLSEGVTVPASGKLTLDVTDTVPQAAFTVGRVTVGCDFGYQDDDIDSHAIAGDEAAVPGAIASVEGFVQKFPEGNGQGKPVVGVPGVRLVIAAADLACPVAGEATTDADGHFVITDIPVGPDYLLYVMPPAGLKVKHDNPTNPDIRGGAPSRMLIEVEDGTATPPTVPTQPASCTTTTTPPATSTTPAPQGRSSSGLANTGASVTGLGALGLIALLIGTGLLVGVRRRRTS